MNLMPWRREQLWVLAIAIALSAGSGFVGGYFVHAPKTRPQASKPRLLHSVSESQAQPQARWKSYEQALADALDDDTAIQSEIQPSEPLSPEEERAMREEIPMDGIMWTTASDADVPKSYEAAPTTGVGAAAGAPSPAAASQGR